MSSYIEGLNINLNSPYEASTTPSVLIQGNFSFSWVADRRQTLAPALLQHNQSETSSDFVVQQLLHGWMNRTSTTSGFCSSPPWCEPPPHWQERDILTGWTVGPPGLRSARPGDPEGLQRGFIHPFIKLTTDSRVYMMRWFIHLLKATADQLSYGKLLPPSK